MQRLEASGAVRPLYASLGFKGLNVERNTEYGTLDYLAAATLKGAVFFTLCFKQ